jgi:uncharacterized OsmC-like protein
MQPSTNTSGLIRPTGSVRAFALYAHPGSTGIGFSTPSLLPAALAAHGIAVLVVDVSEIPPVAGHENRGSTANSAEAAAVLRAATRVRIEERAPTLLIGHSAAGPAILAMVSAQAGVHAVVTIGSPAPWSPRIGSGVPLLVMHAPRDPVVPVREAGRVFAAARHPKSFVALDGVDHAITDARGAHRVAGLIAAWADPYLSEADTVGPGEDVVVTEDGIGRYAQRITTGRHSLIADEPAAVGGADTGPSPYELLLAALGACTSITLRMYADRKGMHLRRTTVRLRHDRVHARDCVHVEQQTGMLSRIRREIELDGQLTAQDRQRLLEIADRCPVHRTLSSEIAFETTETDAAPIHAS